MTLRSCSLVCALWILASALPVAGEGRLTLPAALEQLRLEGIETLYTSRLVHDDLRVEGMPADGPAEERLRALLAPLGLTARPDSDGRFVVGPAPGALLEGTIRSDPGGGPISSARIHLASGAVGVSDAAGHFRILRVPAGRQRLEITRPGYLDRRLEVDVEAGTRHRLDVLLRLDAETRDEIFVSTAAEEPPLGTWQLGPQRTRDTLLLDQDVLAGASRLPGARPGEGAGFGVRGHEAERLTLVVDGVEIDEPYHFRHLGRLAGAVTPEAVDDVLLHRGSPPVAFGDRAGGVLEVVTETTGRRFAARAAAGDEAFQGSLSGNGLGARLRWLAAYRRGEPDLPPEAGDLGSRPAFWDGLAKVSTTLDARHELTFQTLWTSDTYAVTRDVFFIRALTILQDSRYSHVRYLGAFGDRHLLDLKLSQSEVERNRFGQEQQADLLTPPDTNPDFVLDDRRNTRRDTGRADGTSTFGSRFEWHWGAESENESTAYDYLLFAPFRREPDSPDGPYTTFVGDLRQARWSLYSRAVWRPRDDLTVSAGARFDEDDLSDESAWMPRVGATFRHASAVWRAGWARVRDFPSSQGLPVADGEFLLPGTETSDYASLGYELRRGSGSLAVEVYHQRIRDPRLRFENLVRSVSRFPELEIDRIRVDAEASRSRGVEVRYAFRGRRFNGSAAYELSRFEDRLPDGGWRPRRSDRPHALHLRATFRLPRGWQTEVLWRGFSGRPTTPLDIEAITTDFAGAVGEIHGERLPAEHRLDLRLHRSLQLSATTIRLGIGVDNLYDRRPVTGFDLLPLLDAAEPPTEIPAERGLGRTFRWSFELSW